MAAASHCIPSANCRERCFGTKDAAASSTSRRQFKRSWPCRRQFKVRADPQLFCKGCGTYHSLQKAQPRRIHVQTVSDRLITHANVDNRQAIAKDGCQDVEEQLEDRDIDPYFVSAKNIANVEEVGQFQKFCPQEVPSPTGARTRRELLAGTHLSGLALTVSFQARKTFAAVAPVPAGAKEASADAVSTPSVAKSSSSRIYDASVLGEPFAVGKDKGRVWQKILAARVVYLGESERVPDPDDKAITSALYHLYFFLTLFKSLNFVTL
ncbi:hypothetical protein L7F22_000390 [Adiantum nelumboides]|nr:hypothetical protein [Adiantum nelumboides]